MAPLPPTKKKRKKEKKVQRAPKFINTQGRVGREVQTTVIHRAIGISLRDAELQIKPRFYLPVDRANGFVGLSNPPLKQRRSL